MPLDFRTFAAASAFLAALADAEVTVVRRVVSSLTNASSSTPVSGSQPAIVLEAYGAKTFDVSGEAVRLRPEDWDCGACPPTIVSDYPWAIAGKVVVGHTPDWGCGRATVCGGQSFARALSAANVTAWIGFDEIAAANPLFVVGIASRALVSGETRDPPDLRGFVCPASSSPGPLLESFAGIPYAGIQARAHEAGPPDYISYTVRVRSGDTNTNVPLWDDGPWWTFQVHTLFFL